MHKEVTQIHIKRPMKNGFSSWVFVFNQQQYEKRDGTQSRSFSLSKTSVGSKGIALCRVEGTKYPPNIAPPLGEGLGWGQF